MRLNDLVSLFALTFLVGALFSGCASRATSAQEQPPKPTLRGEKREGGLGVAPQGAPSTPKTEPVPAAKPVPIVPAPRIPIVGGCNLDCIKPDVAAQNFFRALLSEPEKKSDGVPGEKKSREASGASPLPSPSYFLDSREFEDRGARLGEKWHEMWVAGERKERGENIQEYLGRLRASILGVNTGVVAKALVDANLKATSARPGQASYIFVAPGMADPLRATFHKRGVEWLLYRLETHQ